MMKQSEFMEIVESKECEKELRELKEAGNTLPHRLLHALYELFRKILSKEKGK